VNQNLCRWELLGDQDVIGEVIEMTVGEPEAD
jgi:hypothetical protein